MTVVDNLKLEVAFSDGPDVASPTWTDITSYWVQAAQTTITRGRPDEGEVPPGTLSLTLDNTDGRFAAGYVSSPYYPNVKLRKQIRITYREQTTTRTNVCTNPNFETNITSWSAFANVSAPTRSTSGPYSGVGRLDAVGNNTGTAPRVQFTTTGHVVGDTWTLSGRVKQVATWPGGGTTFIALRWQLTAGGETIQSSAVAYAPDGNGWQRISVTGTVPAGANGTLITNVGFNSLAGNLTASGSLGVDEVLLEKASSLGTYFDGSTVDGTSGWDYAWNGATDASTSTATPTVYPRFQGHVDEWPTEWPTGDNTYAQAQITASDRTKRIQQLIPFRGVPQEAIMVDSPVAYWPLTESSGATTAANLVAGSMGDLSVAQLGTGGTIAFGDGTGVATDSAGAVMLTPASGANGKYLVATGSISAFRVAAGVCINTTDTDGVIFQLGVNPLDSNAFVALYLDAGSLKLKVANPTHGFVSTFTTGATINDGHTHDVSVLTSFGTIVGTKYIELYVDGALAYSSTLASSTDPIAFDRVLIGGGEDNLCTGGDALAATLSHFRVYTTSITSGAQLIVCANGTLNGFRGESSDTRIARYAAWVGMSSFTNLDAGSSTSITHIDVRDRAPWEAMRDVTTTEGGQLFASRDGEITFHARSRRYTAATAATLDTANLDIGESLMFRINDRFLLNDITVTTPDEFTTRQTDSTSIADNGSYRTSQDVFTTSTLEALSFAQWAVGLGGTPTPRAEQLEVDLLTNSAIRLSLLVADISTRIGLAGLPAGAGAPAATADLFIEGYTETISVSEWSLSLSTTPAAPVVGVWRLETTGFTELGTTTRLAF